MKILLIDGGATSTKTYVVESSKIISTNTFEYMSIQMHEIHSLSVLEKIKEYYKDLDLVRIFIGCPGVHQYKKPENIKKIFQNSEIMTDIEIQDMLYIKDIKNHYIMSLGSGTIILEIENEKKRFINSFGPFVGDDGSAFGFAKLFLKQSIMDYDKKNINSVYIKMALEAFDCKNVEDIKKVYDDWNTIRSKFLEFAKKILTNKYSKNKEEIDFILKQNIDNLITYIKYIDLKKDFPFYIVGGMSKNEFCNKYLITKLNSLGFKMVVIK